MHTAKELDNETSHKHFGARYFDPAGSHGAPRLFIRINEKYSEKYENYN
ncbi:MAG TPA: hypothetical protein PLO66_02695 [Bacteroidales bacterium]|jgi:hypothetical protein|nr:hypothetical protein [Bacteroidales bacterium]HOL75264.1 hypothetical protein [Bacteroidales bacterium]HPU46643.1 hypothetical protein [Bacteroidales bacterium]HXK91111.1 hypothetical protein [Bacteroidales bacterium]